MPGKRVVPYAKLPRSVAAWAWLWRSFDMLLPDVPGAAPQAEPPTTYEHEQTGPRPEDDAETACSSEGQVPP
ncbi:hypothetical protein AB0L33_32865 [Streptomyces sp. NPDC052299]|uniref:hypothetical protein n=1 Tax=Streptomyces sp. NPDC052299 TaxID=3155054 RepID=UPI0034312222